MSLQSQQNHKENYDEEAFKLFQLLNIDITEGRGCFKDLVANIKSNIHNY